MSDIDLIKVVYISANKTLYCNEVPYKKNMTAEMAIEQSKLLEDILKNEGIAIDLAKYDIGVHGKKVRLGHILKPYNRVEIYRSLSIDPKQARRQRALMNK